MAKKKNLYLVWQASGSYDTYLINYVEFMMT